MSVRYSGGEASTLVEILIKTHFVIKVLLDLDVKEKPSIGSSTGE